MVSKFERECSQNTLMTWGIPVDVQSINNTALTQSGGWCCGIGLPRCSASSSYPSSLRVSSSLIFLTDFPLYSSPSLVLLFFFTSSDRISPTMSITTYTLPALPYAYNALEPSISAQIMELHHGKHHQAYVTNLNAALKSYSAATSTSDIAGQIALQSAIKFNGGGHINHSLFWENLSPADSPDAKPDSAPTLVAEISRVWGSLEAFQAAFAKTLLGLQGSGWGWLVKDAQGLRIVTTKDQDPVVGGEVPVFGVDMWEHAYYLQYLNGKAAYIDNIWKVINWKTAEARFIGSREDAFKVLRASI